MSKYPKAIDMNRVGEYPALAKSGAGYFYDDVLEYRVWCHPELGATTEPDDDGDYYYAFGTYEEALAFSESTKGAEEPLVLIRQIEWINEPQPNNFIHEKGERIAEWQVSWLDRGKRTEHAIDEFIKVRTSKKV